MEQQTTPPLAGIRVLDLSRLLPGPQDLRPNKRNSSPTIRTTVTTLNTKKGIKNKAAPIRTPAIMGFKILLFITIFLFVYS